MKLTLTIFKLILSILFQVFLIPFRIVSGILYVFETFFKIIRQTINYFINQIEDELIKKI